MENIRTQTNKKKTWILYGRFHSYKNSSLDTIIKVDGRPSARVSHNNIKITQLSSASRLSARYWCRIGPKPDGDWNCLTMAFVRSCCWCDMTGSNARKYSSIVCSNGGTGTFGKSCKEQREKTTVKKVNARYVRNDLLNAHVVGLVLYAIQLSHTFDDENRRIEWKIEQ